MAAVNLWFPGGKSGILTSGTGRAESFRAVADARRCRYTIKGSIEFHSVPDVAERPLSALYAGGFNRPPTQRGLHKPLFKTVAERRHGVYGPLNRDA